MGANMSRRRLPRRQTLAILTLALAAGGVFAAPARAQWDNQHRSENTFRTVFGAPAVAACSQAAANGDSSDAAVATCTNALGDTSIGRPARIATYINRGALHLRRREGQPALEDFDAVIALDRRNAEAYVNRGAALVLIGRPGPAVAAITEALGLGVREPHKAYFNRGAARESLGDLRGAYEDYSTALQIEPDWGPANAELARFARARRERLAGVVGVVPGADGRAIVQQNEPEGTP